MKAGDNPFAPGRLERVLGFDPALVGTSWEALGERWRETGFRAAVTGRHGAGKSALLRAWAGRLDEPVRLHFNEQRRRLDDEDRDRLAGAAGRWLLVDGDHHLDRRDRREFLRAVRLARGVLVARHRPGPWPELIRLRSSPDLAAALLERAAPDHLEVLQGGLARRLRHCRGNLRELWLDCYDRLAARATAHRIQTNAVLFGEGVVRGPDGLA